MFEMNEWGQVTVRSQEEWDALMRRKPAGARFARIDAPATETIRLLYSDNGLSVIVAGESSVVTIGVDVRACDNARVRASGVCIVSAQGNVRVWACDRVVVHAGDDARVWASGMCVVYVCENATVWAGSHVTVYKETRFGPFRGHVQGGRVVVKRDADEMMSEQWCRAALVHVDEDGMAHLFKATDSEGASHRGGLYRPGEVDAIVDKYEGEPSFVCVNGYTGEECEFHVGELQPGTVIFVEDDSEGDIMFAYVDGVAYEEMWRVTNHYGDVFEVDEPSVDRLAPGATGRLPVVYPVLD